jgi:hypothetical protein
VHELEADVIWIRKNLVAAQRFADEIAHEHVELDFERVRDPVVSIGPSGADIAEVNVLACRRAVISCPLPDVEIVRDDADAHVLAEDAYHPGERQARRLERINFVI